MNYSEKQIHGADRKGPFYHFLLYIFGALWIAPLIKVIIDERVLRSKTKTNGKIKTVLDAGMSTMPVSYRRIEIFFTNYTKIYLYIL